MLRFLIFLTAIIILSTSQAATFTVDNAIDNEVGSLRDVLSVAQDSDTINFSKDLNGIEQLLDSEIQISANITIIGNGPDLTVFEIEDFGRHFRIMTNAKARLVGMTLRGGRETSDFGGTILMEASANLELEDVTITLSEAARGGAIYLNDSKSSLTARRCIFEENNVPANQVGDAVFIGAQAIAEFENCTFLGNGKTNNSSGKAIYYEQGSESQDVRVLNCLFENNGASFQGDGGAIYIGNQCAMLIDGCLFNANEGNHGGAIYFAPNSTNCSISNSTFTENIGAIGGGAIYYEGDGGTEIVNCTIHENQTFDQLEGYGAGIFVGGANALLRIKNSIISDNQTIMEPGTDDIYAESADIFLSSGHNVISRHLQANNNVSLQSSDLIGSPTNPLDPLLSVLKDNGGFTQTFAILCNSPALDAGTDNDVSLVDQRGEDRTQGNATDIGAYEYPGLVVTNLVTNTEDSGCGSLRYWVVNAADGSIITFDQSLVKDTIPVLSQEIIISKNIEITGLGPGELFLDGMSTNRIFNVAAGASLVLKSISIINGQEFTDGGGAIVMQNGTTASFAGVDFEENKSTGTSSSGGVLSMGGNSSATFDDCYFTKNNSLGNGGCIHTNNNSYITITNSEFFDNSANNQGGAVYSSNGNSNIVNSTFQSNRAGFDGGAVFLGGSLNDTIIHCTFADNQAINGSGGAISNQASFGSNPLYLLHSTIVNNSANFSGGGIHTTTELTFGNDIIAENSLVGTNPSKDIDNSSTSSVSLGFNFIGIGDGLNMTPNAQDLIGTSVDPIYPDLKTLDQSEEFPRIMLPNFGSSVVDAGFNFGGYAVDQIGKARVFNGQIDIGAAELNEVCDTFLVSKISTDPLECGGLFFAVEMANSTLKQDTISFDMNVSGYTIFIDGPVEITSPIVIDGQTDPEFGDSPVVHLQSTLSMTGMFNGINVMSDSVLIRGLRFNGFSHAINVESSEFVQVFENYIGTDSTGDAIALQANATGIYMFDCMNSTIKKNVIGGSSLAGIYLEQSVDNSIENNRVGAGKSDQALIPNEIGVLLDQSANSNILVSNIIRANFQEGLRVSNSKNVDIVANFIENSVLQGILLTNDSNISITSNSLSYNGYDNEEGVEAIGVVDVINSTFGSVTEGNSIFENANSGISLFGISTGNSIRGNTISENKGRGILLDGSSVDLISISRNSFSCNAVGIDLIDNANQDFPKPVIIRSNQQAIRGTSSANATVHIYYTDLCNKDQGETFLAKVVANASGEWSYSGAIETNSFVVATATSTVGQTSIFSDRKVVVFCNDKIKAKHFSRDVYTFDESVFGPIVNLTKDQTVEILIEPFNGTAVIQGDSLIYKSDRGFEGQDLLVYQFTNSCGVSSQGIINLNVSIKPLTVKLIAGDSVQVKIEVPDNVDTLSFQLFEPTSIGLVRSIDFVNGFLTVDYSDTTDFQDTDSIFYEVCDFGGTCIQRVVVAKVRAPLEKEVSFEVFNAVSPNNDGFHDFLRIEIIQDGEAYEPIEARDYNLVVTVYNQAGDLLYESNEYRNNSEVGFVGVASEFNNKELSDGTYFYIIELDTQKERQTQRGYLVLKR